MKNITLSINKDMLKKTGKSTLREDETMSAIMRKHLEQIAEDGDRLEQVVAELRKMSETSSAELSPCYKWNREDSYER
jgi:hypothetical protein